MLEFQERNITSFLHGGVSEGGLAQPERGEVFFNPQQNTLADLGSFLKDVGVSVRGGHDAVQGGGIGGGNVPANVNVFPTNYGAISAAVDVDEVLDRMAEETANAVYRSGGD